MICAQALLHFRAQETYEKYLKMLVSIMILIQLFIPVGAFFMGEKKDETAEALRQFKQDMEAGIQAECSRGGCHFGADDTGRSAKPHGGTGGSKRGRTGRWQPESE